MNSFWKFMAGLPGTIAMKVTNYYKNQKEKPKTKNGIKRKNTTRPKKN